MGVNSKTTDPSTLTYLPRIAAETFERPFIVYRFQFVVNIEQLLFMVSFFYFSDS
jgi:hypothetical protein